MNAFICFTEKPMVQCIEEVFRTNEILDGPCTATASHILNIENIRAGLLALADVFEKELDVNASDTEMTF